MIFLFLKKSSRWFNLKFKAVGIFQSIPGRWGLGWGMKYLLLPITLGSYFLRFRQYKEKILFADSLSSHWNCILCLADIFLIAVRFSFHIPLSYIYIPKSQIYQQLQMKSPSSSLTILFSQRTKCKWWLRWSILIVFLWKIMKLPLRYTICHNCVFSQE